MDIIEEQVLLAGWKGTGILTIAVEKDAEMGVVRTVSKVSSVNTGRTIVHGR